MHVFLLKADSEHFVNTYNMPGHWGANKCCRMCPADCSLRTPMSWNNFSGAAGWQPDIFRINSVWFAHCVAAGKDVWLVFAPRSEGGMGLSVYAAFDDSMHSVDLGVNPHLLGNVLWHIAYTDIFGAGPPEARLARAWEYIQTEYSKRRTGIQVLVPWHP